MGMLIVSLLCPRPKRATFAYTGQRFGLLSHLFRWTAEVCSSFLRLLDFDLFRGKAEVLPSVR
jgi:hypothetical protein